MKSVIIKLNGCTVALAPIEPSGLPRREREREAVAALLAQAAGRPAEIAHTPEGAPITDVAGLHISVSHSQHTAALLWSDTPGYGIDVEENRAGQLERVAPRVLTAEELEVYGAIPDGLLMAWTLKEAAFKAAGLPDVADLREIALPLKGGKAIGVRGRRLHIVHSGWQGVVYMSVVKLIP